MFNGPIAQSRRTGRGRRVGLGLLLTALLLVTGCTTSGRATQAAFRRVPPRPPALSPIAVALKLQAQALERGDEAGWLAPVDAAKPDLVQRYREMFRSMRAAGVFSLTVINARDITNVGSGPHSVLVGYAYCIQVLICPTVGLGGSSQPTETIFTQVTVTQLDSQVSISGIALMPIPSNGLGRAPWVDAKLEFRSGARVTVAASAGLRNRLPAAVAAGDAAAAVTDRYALWDWPIRYIVYLANPSEWRSWVAGYPGNDDVLAYAASPSTSSEVVVVNVALLDVDANPLVSVLRHEFGHVVTLFGVPSNSVTAHRLFIEGIAEYIAEDGRPLNSYLRMDLTRRYLHSRRWNGDIDSVEQLFSSDTLDDVQVAYGMGMLTWRCIADRYGKPKMLDFAEKVLRKAASAETAATDVLGQPWSAVKTSCATYFRQL